MLELRPVERICICSVPVSVPGNNNHSAACNRQHAVNFFATVAVVRETLKSDLAK